MITVTLNHELGQEVYTAPTKAEARELLQNALRELGKRGIRFTGWSFSR